ncbi:MAG: oxidoreductase [Myxococcales bacterium]|nr:oxidoreductase [Myxococcales bacterium]
MSDSPRVGSVVALAGASGLVGSRCLEALLAHTGVEGVVSVGRRHVPTAHPKLTQVEVDFAALGPDTASPRPVQAAICALGTTLAKAGSRDAFRAVDHDAVLAFARWAKAQGASTFVLVSSVGANPNARSFYLKVKGQVEAALADMGWQRLVALHPGLLLGKREESRPGEAVARAMMPLLNPLLRGPLTRFRGVSAEVVASAAVRACRADSPGIFVWEHAELVGPVA